MAQTSFALVMLSIAASVALVVGLVGIYRRISRSSYVAVCEAGHEDAAYFYQFSIDGYALGINILLHAMTHSSHDRRCNSESVHSSRI